MSARTKAFRTSIIVVVSMALVFQGSAAFFYDKEIGDIRIDFDPDRGQTAPLADAVFEDGFEAYDDFVLDFPPWTQFDGDGSGTWGSTAYNFTNEYYTGSFIIFNASSTDPPGNGTSWDAHSGYKYAACFAATSPPNDDWLITPAIVVGNYTIYVGIHCVTDDAFVFQLDDFLVTETDNGLLISFWAKSVTDQYGLERFQIGVSTTDNNPESFEIITPEPYVEPPVEWTEYSYEYEFETTTDFEVDISGGVGLTVSISNLGAENVTNLSYSIVLHGGLILIGAETNGTINITAGESAEINVLPIGFGKPTISVVVDDMEPVNATALLILFFILNVQ